MRNLGHCSACERPAEMGASGNWWHLGPTCTSRGVVNADPDRWEPAEFVPRKEVRWQVHIEPARTMEVRWQ